MLLGALLSILYFEGFFPNYRDFPATDPICSLLRDKASDPLSRANSLAPWVGCEY
jgi:hypothetical protein